MASASTAFVETHELSVAFGGVQVLRNLTLRLFEGDEHVVGLVGPNGAGKTTLLNALSGHLDRMHGRVVIAGQDVTGWKAHRIARHGVARSFQTARLLDAEDVGTNLRVGRYRFDRGRLWLESLFPLSLRVLREQRTRAEEMGDQLGLHDRRQTTTVAALPFGERRMVEMGRILMAEPELALLDEPAAGLTEAQRRQLGELLRERAAHTRTRFLVIEHDMSFVRTLCDHLVVLHEGALLASGKPADVLARSDVQDVYFGGGRDAEA